MLSMWQIIIVLVILLIFFGPARIEKLGPSLGKAIRGFKKGMAEGASEEEAKKELEDKKVVDVEDSSESKKDETSKS